MVRCFQYLLIISTIALSWLGMMIVHELGHVFHSWLSGGVVAWVELHPLGFSRTDLSRNPHPMFVAWGGAIWGCMIPLCLLPAVRLLARTCTYLAAFFCGFCLIANGAYLAAGSFIGAGDAADLLRAGASQWQLGLFGIPALAIGLWLWNGLGPHFGLGQSAGRVDRRAALGVAAALIIVVVAELVLSG